MEWAFTLIEGFKPSTNSVAVLILISWGTSPHRIATATCFAPEEVAVEFRRTVAVQFRDKNQA